MRCDKLILVDGNHLIGEMYGELQYGSVDFPAKVIKRTPTQITVESALGLKTLRLDKYGEWSYLKGPAYYYLKK